MIWLSANRRAQCRSTDGGALIVTELAALRPDLLSRRASRAALAETTLDIIDHHLLEIRSDSGTAQRHRLLAVDEDRCGRALTGAGQRNADVGVLALAGTVDDAAHHRDVEGLDPRVLLLPFRHRSVNEALDIA